MTGFIAMFKILHTFVRVVLNSGHMKNHITSGCVGAIVTILILFVACAFFEPFHYKPVYILNPQKVLSPKDSITNDSLKCLHIEVLKDLENKGLLLTPSEYTSHISSYYSTLVAFLIGLFVLFTIGNIYALRITSKKEIEDIREELDNKEKEIRENLKRNIKESLNELLRDSISFKESAVDALYGRIEDELITRSDKEIIDNKLRQLEEDVKLLFESYDEIPDKKSSKEEIE